MIAYIYHSGFNLGFFCLGGEELLVESLATPTYVFTTSVGIFVYTRCVVMYDLIVISPEYNNPVAAGLIEL